MVRKKTLENMGRAPQGAPSGPHRSDRSFTKETDGKVSCRMSYEEEARGLLGVHGYAQKWDLDVQTGRALGTQRR